LWNISKEKRRKKKKKKKRRKAIDINFKIVERRSWKLKNLHRYSFIAKKKLISFMLLRLKFISCSESKLILFDNLFN
jgi:hypothetical protein